MGQEYLVNAQWDPEAEVYVATSEDVPGLVTEAPDEKSLDAKLREMIPELLVLNGVLPKDHHSEIRYRVKFERLGSIAPAVA